MRQWQEWIANGVSILPTQHLFHELMIAKRPAHDCCFHLSRARMRVKPTKRQVETNRQLGISDDLCRVMDDGSIATTELVRVISLRD